MAVFEDGFSALELSRKFFRETGLDIAQLDLRIRQKSVDLSANSPTSLAIGKMPTPSK